MKFLLLIIPLLAPRVDAAVYACDRLKHMVSSCLFYLSGRSFSSHALSLSIQVQLLKIYFGFCSSSTRSLSKICPTFVWYLKKR